MATQRAPRCGRRRRRTQRRTRCWLGRSKRCPERTAQGRPSPSCPRVEVAGPPSTRGLTSGNAVGPLRCQRRRAGIYRGSGLPTRPGRAERPSVAPIRGLPDQQAWRHLRFPRLTDTYGQIAQVAREMRLQDSSVGNWVHEAREARPARRRPRPSAPRSASCTLSSSGSPASATSWEKPSPTSRRRTRRTVRTRGLSWPLPAGVAVRLIAST